MAHDFQPRDRMMLVYADEPNELGESPLWHASRKSLFWLDILKRTLYEKPWPGGAATATTAWSLPEHASVIARDRHDDHVLWMVTDESFGKFDLDKQIYQPVTSLGIAASHRANDGSVSPHGDFWFGTMEWSPSGINGGIYSISPAGTLREHGIPMGIPNTFAWSADGTMVYISDSYRQKIFSYTVENREIARRSERVVADLSGTATTPDGGALDQHGCLWNAHWDGHAVVKYGRGSEVEEKLHMPVPRPSSCCFGGPGLRHLFVTSARTAMSSDELSRHPLSGSVFVTELETPGILSTPFRSGA